MELQKNIYLFSKEMNTLNEIIREFNTFDFLYLLYTLMNCRSNIMKKVSIEMLILLLKNLPYEQEFKLKSLILSRTLIIFNLLSIYFKPPNDVLRNLSLKFLKSFLISHVEATNLITNLFPMTLFYHVYKDKKPNPINWLDHEWDNFFHIVLKDTQSTQLIWNQNCRNELLESIQVLTSRYESFTDDKYLVHSLNLDVEYIYNNNAERDEGVSGIKKTESLQMENSLSANTNINTNLNFGLNNNNRLFSLAQFNFSNLNVSYYCLNYKEIKFEYLTLKKHVFVWQYYLKKLINEALPPNFNQHIEKPKKFWNKLMSELINTFNENKILLIIKTLTLLYKFYSEIIGPFKEYKYFINIFSSTKNIDIKIMIVQLFSVTLENEEKEIKEPNLKNLIETQTPEHLLNFISELNSIEKVKENIKHINYENTRDYLNKTREEKSCNFLDNKETFLKNLTNNYSEDKLFPLYAQYIYVDESWNTADKSVKVSTLIIRFLKAIMKKYSIVNEVDFKINFPIPQVKLIFFDAQNFLRILSLLYIDNENLILETLDLIINFMNDPLTYKMVMHYTNTIDILIYFMIKYKSKNIMKFIDNMYYYHNVFFSFDFFRKNPSDEFVNGIINTTPSSGNLMSYRKDSINIASNAVTKKPFGNTVIINTNNNSGNMITNNNVNNNLIAGQNSNLINNNNIINNNNLENNNALKNNNFCYISDDEYDFFENYQNANKFLSRYFPISLIYHLINSDFSEFMETLHSDVYKPNLIWNAEMFQKLINNLTDLLKTYILLDSPQDSNLEIQNTYYNAYNSEQNANEQVLKIMNFNCLKTNNSNINSLYSNNPLHSYKEFELKNFAFDPKFKIEYKIISDRINCFIYYFDMFVFRKNLNKKSNKDKNSNENVKENTNEIDIDDEGKEEKLNKINSNKDIKEEVKENFSLENYSIENFSIHKSCDFELILEIDPNHYSIIAKSILQKIKKKFLAVKSVYSIIDIEFIIFLKALKFMMEKYLLKFY